MVIGPELAPAGTFTNTDCDDVTIRSVAGTPLNVIEEGSEEPAAKEKHLGANAPG